MKPQWKSEIRLRLAGLRLAPTREAAIVEELAQYLEDCYAELLASGVTPAEAERQTRAELSGSELLARELCRMERQNNSEPVALGTNWRTNMIADLWQDLRFGARILRTRPSSASSTPCGCGPCRTRRLIDWRSSCIGTRSLVELLSSLRPVISIYASRASLSSSSPFMFRAIST